MESVRRPTASETDAMFELFRAFLYETAGIYFQEQNRERLMSHVATRMAATGATDPVTYLGALKTARGNRSELWEFFNQVTVNETYFFREPNQFEVLRDRVLPQLFKRRRDERRDSVTIWSAACSSGEEAYTLAILLKESFPAEAPTTRIVGFDINSQVVDRAQKGEFSEYSVRACPEAQKANCFKKTGKTYVLIPYLKRFATFHVANLMDPFSLRAFPRPDLILCRNALIYFDRDSKARVLKNLADVLLPHGYLFLSLTETLFNIDHSFEVVHFFKACGYRRKT
ncbi:MAG: protein-glutamate O-methyltransferase CheR [Deltaproteobacteria bacterium]|nr:protein-glutamate O-methyltransferase CheR [Deltaproteobacteria bacterium]